MNNADNIKITSLDEVIDKCAGKYYVNKEERNTISRHSSISLISEENKYCKFIMKCIQTKRTYAKVQFASMRIKTRKR